MKDTTRADILAECQDILTDITPDGNHSVQDRLPDPLSDVRDIMRPKQECEINFHWWTEQFDVLSYYRNRISPFLSDDVVQNKGIHGIQGMLPSPQVRPELLSEKHTGNNQDHTETEKIHRSDVYSSDLIASNSHTGSDNHSQPNDFQNEPTTDLESPDRKKRRLNTPSNILPKFYYKPWPRQTHMLSFPEEEFFKFPEDTVATLIHFTTRMQSDDSVELGLRITAHVNRERTLMTIIPSTALWSLLRSTHIHSVTKENMLSLVNVKDMRRALCPYIRLNMGLSEGYSAMMLHGLHWYVILLLEADTFVDELFSTLISATEHEDINLAKDRSLMMTYQTRVAAIKIKDLKLLAMVSLGKELDAEGWDSVKKLMLINLIQALSTTVNTAPLNGSTTNISKMNAEEQHLHFACLSFQAIEHLLWPSRVYISGPEQCNGRTCAAYGLASICKLSSPQGFVEMKSFLREESPSAVTPLTTDGTVCRQRDNENIRFDEVPILNFPGFYNDDYVRDVFK